MKKLTALLLLLIMVLSMTACASDQEKMVGTWETEMDLAPVFNNSLGNGEDAAYLTVDSLVFKIVLTFTEEGTYTMTADTDSVSAAMASLKTTLKNGMERYLVDTMGENGLELTLDQILALMDVTVEELIDQVVTQELIDQVIQSMVSAGNFKAEDGKLYLSGSTETEIDESIYDTYVLEDNKLTLVTTNINDAYTDLMYPLEFTRVAE